MTTAAAPAGALTRQSPLPDLEAGVKASWAAFCAGNQTRAAHYRIVGWAIDARRSAATKAKGAAK